MSGTDGRSDTEGRLQRVARPHLKFADSDQSDPSADLGELGRDSMATIALLVDVEDEFAIEIPEDLLEDDTFSTLASLAAVVDGLRAPA